MTQAHQEEAKVGSIDALLVAGRAISFWIQVNSLTLYNTQPAICTASNRLKKKSQAVTLRHLMVLTGQVLKCEQQDPSGPPGTGVCPLTVKWLDMVASTAIERALLVICSYTPACNARLLTKSKVGANSGLM